MESVPTELLKQYLNEIFEESPSKFEGIEDLRKVQNDEEISEPP